MGNKWGNSVRLYFFGLQNTADGDCSHENKRCLLLGREVMTNLDSILKSRDITLPTKVHLVKAVVFPVVMYRCESWTVKKAEHQRIDVFELWYWRRLLRVPWTARRSKQSILKEISPEYPLEGLMLKLNGLTGSPCSPRDSQESSPTTQFKSDNSLALSQRIGFFGFKVLLWHFLYISTLTSILDY